MIDENDFLQQQKKLEIENSNLFGQRLVLASFYFNSRRRLEFSTGSVHLAPEWRICSGQIHRIYIRHA